MDKTPGTTKISAEKLMGGASSSLGKVGQGGESKVGKLARIVRTTRVKVNDNEKKITINVEKISNNYDSIEEVTESLNSLHEQMVEQMLNKMDEEEKGEEKVTGESVEGISKSLDVIAVELASLGTLMADNLKQRKQQAEQDRLEDQRKKQAKEEAKAEKQKKKERSQKLGQLGGFVKKLTFFDQIKKFFGNILAGSAILAFFNWIKDPENIKKYNQFIDFFADNVPIIIAGIAGFLAIGLGVKLVGILTALKGAIAGLAGILGSGGLLAVIGALGIAATGLIMRELFENFITMVTGEDRDLREERYAESALLKAAKMNPKGEPIRGGMGRNAHKTTGKPRTPEQEKIWQAVLEARRTRGETQEMRDDVRERRDAEIKAAEEASASNVAQIREDNMINTSRGTRLSNEGQKLLAEERSRLDTQKGEIHDRYNREMQHGKEHTFNANNPGEVGEAAKVAGVTPMMGADPKMYENAMSFKSGDFNVSGDTGEFNINTNLKGDKSFTKNMMKFDAMPIKIDIGTPVIDTPKITALPLGGGGDSSPKSMAAGAQSPTPAFSAVDPNNPMITTINSIYNSVN